MPTIHVQHDGHARILSDMSSRSATVVRSWSARATAAGADAYVRHFQDVVLPSLRRLPGHCGALVLRRSGDPDVEIVVLTLWASMDPVRTFAGADASVAVVEPEARATLTAFDAHVTHYDLVVQAGS
jgi:heme-degrading monooxygenase HmoA